MGGNAPASIPEVVYALGSIPFDATTAVMPSADHILYTRLGWPYQPADLVKAVDVDRDLFEWHGAFRVMSDLPLLAREMQNAPPHQYGRDWLGANARFRRDVLDFLRHNGPVAAAGVPDTAQESWRSSGWTNGRNAQQMLELLVSRGEVAIAGRDRKGRLFDLSERVYPTDLPAVESAAAERERAERRLAAFGIARARALVNRTDSVDPETVGRAAMIDGVTGTWRVDPDALAAVDTVQPRTALLSPFDVLVFERDRLQDVFDAEYVLEMYKPAAKRRWGYFALPILHNEEIVGKLDAKAERRAGELRINAVHRDQPWDAATESAVDEEISALAHWLGLERIDP